MNYIDKVPEGQREQVAQAILSLKDVYAETHRQAVGYASKQLELVAKVVDGDSAKATDFVIRAYQERFAEVLAEKGVDGVDVQTVRI